ncbi:DUF2634 domain-containing protein [Clostridium brassicae]|uniref:DUF2634 domain-containing protein n=1 Tax=Clostridium brassicae TaxID=2999072 RepID=A0ABT4D9Q9_9CLOT|nr:DUF2634 domain-containing protein [Clostridium brassicae]MCY6957966.1 DUF2634 domain-containing protein [Clostridium brassicae]
MAIFPNFNINIKQHNDTDNFTGLGKVFLFDFEKNQYVMRDGKLVECSEKKAVEQWIYFVLGAYKNKYKIYKNTNFHCDVEDLLGKKRDGFVISQLKREIEEAVTRHRYVDHIENFVTTQKKTTLNVDFSVVLKSNEVINISA